METSGGGRAGGEVSVLTGGGSEQDQQGDGLRLFSFGFCCTCPVSRDCHFLPYSADCELFSVFRSQRPLQGSGWLPSPHCRSNGFEQKRFARLASKKAVEELAYKWSVEDM